MTEDKNRDCNVDRLESEIGEVGRSRGIVM